MLLKVLGITLISSCIIYYIYNTRENCEIIKYNNNNDSISRTILTHEEKTIDGTYFTKKKTITKTIVIKKKMNNNYK